MEDKTFLAAGVTWRIADVRSYRDVDGLVNVASATAFDANGCRFNSLSDTPLMWRGRTYPAPYLTATARQHGGTYDRIFVSSGYGLGSGIPNGLQEELSARFLEALGDVAPLTIEERGANLIRSASLVGGNDGHQAARDASPSYPASVSGQYTREAWETFATESASAYLAAMLESYR